jgi:hypothetical protein
MHNWYANLLLDHRWIKKRKECLGHDKYSCQSCHKSYPKVTLCVHHLGYVTGWMPWDYPLTLLQTLCLECHNKVHAGQKPEYVECHWCKGLALDKEIGGRDEKHEWICEKCILKAEQERNSQK